MPIGFIGFGARARAELLVDHELLDRRRVAAPRRAASAVRRTRPRRAAGSSRPGTARPGACSARNARTSAAVRLGLGGQLEVHGRRPTPCAGDRQVGESARDAPFGVYVHIPFCAHRCDYCDFATWTDRAPPDRRVRRRLRRRPRPADASRRGRPARRACSSAAARRRCSRPPALARILGAIPRAAGAEVTVECNPDSVDPAQLDALRRGRREPGLDRGAVDGSRTCSPALGRTHDPAERRRARSARRADAGFERVNLDLIYGTPGETRRRLARARSTARSRSSPDHVSAYALTVEPGTPLGQAVAAGERPRAGRRRPGRQVRDRRRRASRAAGLRVVRDLELGPAGRGVPAQPPLLGAGRLPRDRLRRARHDRRSPVVEPPHPRALHRRDPRPARRAEAGQRGARRRRPAPRRRSLLALRTRAGVAGAAGLEPTVVAELAADGLVEPDRATGSCSPGGAGSSPTTVTAPPARRAAAPRSAAPAPAGRVAVGRLDC